MTGPCPFTALQGSCTGLAMGKSMHVWRIALRPGDELLSCVLCQRVKGERRARDESLGTAELPEVAA